MFDWFLLNFYSGRKPVNIRNSTITEKIRATQELFHKRYGWVAPY